MLTNHIVAAAEQSVPQTSGRVPKRPRPWWNKACFARRKAQKRAWGIFHRYLSTDNLCEFKQRRGQARCTYQQVKRISWRMYVSSINSLISTKEPWTRIERIDGDYSCFAVPLLKCGPNSLTSLFDQANILGAHFEKVSSSSNYTNEYKKIGHC